MNNKDTINFFGQTDFRNQKVKFGIKTDDRRRHMYIIGQTGTGKTTMIENMAIADIRDGKGLAIIDPHGEFAEKMLDYIPEDRIDDVIYFDPADINHPIAFNPLEQVSEEYRHLIASSMMGVFKKIWIDAWSARMEYILSNALLALLEYPNSTLLGIMRMLSDKEYRNKVVSNLKDPVVKSFWVNEFAKYTERLSVEAVAAIQNKVGQFITNPLIRNIVGQPHSSIDMKDVMDNGKILIANLSKGKIGEDNSRLLGAMIITKLQLAAMGRVYIAQEERRDFYLYVDEFQNFSTESFANILSEARKYKLCLIMAHQYIEQLDEKVKSAVFGNVGTLIAFRVGAEDAEFLEKQFSPEFMATDLINLANRHIYVKLMIDGVSSRPFSAATLPPYKPLENSHHGVIIENTQLRHALPKNVVEEKIAKEWMERASIMDEKIKRRDEQPLKEILSPRGQNIFREPKFFARKQEYGEKENMGKKTINLDDLKKSIKESLNKIQQEDQNNDN
ncbi:MAG: type IV secretion system DNA-binding domain-containing protein [Patescibacteria group bacterium]|nr:type IV secretion system DNA-binding domain-containing protein [Patescibacteria group bacterium]